MTNCHNFINHVFIPLLYLDILSSNFARFFCFHVLKLFIFPNSHSIFLFLMCSHVFNVCPCSPCIYISSVFLCSQRISIFLICFQCEFNVLPFTLCNPNETHVYSWTLEFSHCFQHILIMFSCSYQHIPNTITIAMLC